MYISCLGFGDCDFELGGTRFEFSAESFDPICILIHICIYLYICVYIYMYMYICISCLGFGDCDFELGHTRLEFSAESFETRVEGAPIFVPHLVYIYINTYVFLLPGFPRRRF